MRKEILRIPLAVILLFGCVNFSVAFTVEQTDDMLKPSIVHVTRISSGVARLPHLVYDSDASRFNIAGDKALTVDYQETLEATGFIAHPDGVIITDRFVASTDAIKYVLARKHVLNVLEARLLGNPELDDGRLARAMDVLAEKITLKIDTDKVIVEGPTLDQQNISAEIMNKEDVESAADIPTILSIELENLSAVKIHWRGWSTNDYYELHYYEYVSTPNEGRTGKGYEIKRFSLFETAATSPDRISGGSPIFDDDRMVTGIIMFDTKLGRQFILRGPSIVRELKKVKVENRTGRYKMEMLEGINFLELRSCRRAMESFDKAITSTNSNVTEYVTPYMQQCRNMLANGKSLDTFSGFIHRVFESPFMYYILGIFAVVLLTHETMTLSNRIRQRS